MDLAWTNPESYSSIDVYRNTVRLTSISGSAVSYSDTSTTSNVTYTYYLEPYNLLLAPQGNSNSDSQTAWADTMSETLTMTDILTQNAAFNTGEVFTETLTMTDTLTSSCGFSDTFTETITMTDTLLEVMVLSWAFGTYLGTESGNIYEYGEDYVADDSTAVNCMYQTKELDFGDQYPELSLMRKITDRVRVTYKDKYSSTPIIVSVSNDGVNWTAIAKSCGTGADTIKTQDFWFRGKAYTTGRLLRYKVEWGSATTTTEIMKVEIVIQPAGSDYIV